MPNLEGHAKHYSEGGFWGKLHGCAKKAGREVVERGLVLFYSLQDPRLPPWARVMALGALGYLICVLDPVPDFLPGGLLDDAAVLAAVLATLAAHVPPEAREKAAQKVREIFGG